jgi:hypothetical protein
MNFMTPTQYLADAIAPITNGAFRNKMKPKICCWLVLLSLGLTGSLRAVDINGTVQAAKGGTATITAQGGLVPRAGDKVDIYFKIPGGDEEISVGSGKVESVKGTTVFVKIGPTTGAVSKDQQARFHSAVATKAVSASPAANASSGTRSPPAPAKGNGPDQKAIGASAKPIAAANKITPEAVVQANVDAYNARDIEAFLATYVLDAKLFQYPDKLLASGREQLRARYVDRFKEPNLHTDVVKRIAMGDFIVDHERITRTFPEGTGISEVVAIYEVRDGKITRGWLIFGANKLDAKR